MTTPRFKTALLVLAFAMAMPAWADRVKDLATVAAQRSNQLIGFGLVVGLQGTGDDASVPFTTQSMKAMLSQMGVRIDGPLSDFDTGGGGYLEIFENHVETPAPGGVLFHLAIRATDVTAVTERVRVAGCKITVEPKDVVIATTNGAGPVPVRLAFFEGPNGEVWELFQNELT